MQPMTTPTNRSTQEGEYELSYKIFADDGLGNQPVEIPVGKSQGNDNSFLAVNYLRFARLRIRDSPIKPGDFAEDAEFPYRNRYGPLTDDPNDKWGYKFRGPNDGFVQSLWIEKSGPRVDFLNESTFKGLIFVSEIPQRTWEDQQRQFAALRDTPVGSGGACHETPEVKDETEQKFGSGEAGNETAEVKGAKEDSEAA